jgi:hypothetical protein
MQFRKLFGLYAPHGQRCVKKLGCRAKRKLVRVNVSEAQVLLVQVVHFSIIKMRKNH